MKENTNSSSKKITRKKFFIYAGAAAAGVYSLTKLPFEIFKSKVENSQAKNEVKFKENSLAVKRTINTKSNG
ncbi:MAG: hypothetical protein K1X86_14085 [Ignavibacteria bacterium]|nr:hypothetical protein [Ignavibacteria bacterium]